MKTPPISFERVSVARKVLHKVDLKIHVIIKGPYEGTYSFMTSPVLEIKRVTSSPRGGSLTLGLGTPSYVT